MKIALRPELKRGRELKRNLDRNKHLNKDHFDALSDFKTIPNLKGKYEQANVVSNNFRRRIKCVCMRQVKGLSLHNTASIEV